MHSVYKGNIVICGLYYVLTSTRAGWKFSIGTVFPFENADSTNWTLYRTYHFLEIWQEINNTFYILARMIKLKNYFQNISFCKEFQDFNCFLLIQDETKFQNQFPTGGKSCFSVGSNMYNNGKLLVRGLALRQLIKCTAQGYLTIPFANRTVRVHTSTVTFVWMWQEKIESKVFCK